MTDIEIRIHTLRLLLGSQTLLSYAPSVARAVTKELDHLLIQNELEMAMNKSLKKAVAKEVQEQLLTATHKTINTSTINREGDKPSRFLISTFLLSESFAYLCRQPEESLHLATGVSIGDNCTVETLVPVALSQATVVSAEAEKEAVSRILAHLDRLGHCLTGVFHIHPGDGPATTSPSGVDYAYMGRLAGRALVFGIWSRDAYCRILTVPSNSPVQLYGDGVTEHRKENDAVIYKLAAVGESVLGFKSGPAERMVVGRKLVRPAGTDHGI